MAEAPLSDRPLAGPRMPIRFSHTPPDFMLAFVVAPIAGVVAASGTAIIWAVATFGLREGVVAILAMAAIIDVYTLAISTMYTVVAGTLVALAVRRFGVVPSRGFAIATGVVIGFFPFLALSLLIGTGGHSPDRLLDDVMLAPTIALPASVATAWTFWALGLKGRLPGGVTPGTLSASTSGDGRERESLKAGVEK